MNLSPDAQGETLERRNEETDAAGPNVQALKEMEDGKVDRQGRAITLIRSSSIPVDED